VADEVDTVTCGGDDRQGVFDLALHVVVGAVAATAPSSTRVDPHGMPLGEESLDEREGVEVAHGAMDEHERRSATRPPCGERGPVG
jgi:hypothetical protein